MFLAWLPQVRRWKAETVVQPCLLAAENPAKQVSRQEAHSESARGWLEGVGYLGMRDNKPPKAGVTQNSAVEAEAPAVSSKRQAALCRQAKPHLVGRQRGESQARLGVRGPVAPGGAAGERQASATVVAGGRAESAAKAIQEVTSGHERERRPTAEGHAAQRGLER